MFSVLMRFACLQAYPLCICSLQDSDATLGVLVLLATTFAAQLNNQTGSDASSDASVPIALDWNQEQKVSEGWTGVGHVPHNANCVRTHAKNTSQPQRRKQGRCACQEGRGQGRL